MIDVVTRIALAVVMVSTVMAAYRALTGPTVPDRAVGADTVATGIMAIVLLSSIQHDSLVYIDVVLILAVLSFLGTVALAKYIAKGVIIDRDTDS